MKFSKFRLSAIASFFFHYSWRFMNVRKFKSFGYSSFIKSPLKIVGHKYISIGKKVFVNYKTSIVAIPKTGFPNPVLEIKDGSVIGNFNHIYATKKIVTGVKVLTADKVYISDNLHGYENIQIPIMDQPIKQNGEVIIGDGTWIGENACILGVSIGKNCVIGANTVVTKDVPGYCVVVGAPGRIIRRFNVKEQCWLKTDSDGRFMQ